MRTQIVALAGAFLLTGAVALAPSASAQAPAASATPASTSSDFISMLAPISPDAVAGSGELWVTLNGNSAKFTLQVSGLLANSAHAADIYLGQGQCPAVAASSGGAGQSVSPVDPTPLLGTVSASLTTTGDTSASSALALTRFPAEGAYTYSRTFDVDPAVTTALRNGTALFVIHGVDGNDNGKYDETVGGAVSSEASHPALCGRFVAAQMQSVPAGSADTGGGSTAVGSLSTEIWFGSAAVLTAMGIALVAIRRRQSGRSFETVVTNGFRRKLS
jgi:hypothetical protein